MRKTRAAGVARSCAAFFVVLPLVVAFSFSARSEEPKKEPLAVTIYYSSEDPSWTAAEKSIDAAAQRFAGKITLEKVSLDVEDGYRRLARVEKEIPIEHPGEVTAVVGRFALTSKGRERRDVEQHLAAVLARMLEPGEIKRRREADATAFAREAFANPEAQTAKAGEQLGMVYFEVQAGAKPVGWVVEVYRAIHCPVCSDAQFLVAVSPALKVLALKPVRELELWGAPMEPKQAEAFLAQFVGRDPERRVKVDAVSGATKTSLAYAQAVAEVLSELKRRSEQK